MPKKKTIAGGSRRIKRKARALGPTDLLFQLYKAYEPIVDKHLWPWESLRWQELVNCILTAVVESKVTPTAIREVTRIMGWVGLLNVNRLAALQAPADPTLTTIATLLEGAGFTTEESQVAASAIREAAVGFQRAYEGKVQKYLRHYGMIMLDEVIRTFSFSQLSGDATRRAFSLWLQNVLNMPVPTDDPMCNQTCKRLEVPYEAMVKAADEIDLNVSLLDNVLRAYSEGEIEVPVGDMAS